MDPIRPGDATRSPSAAKPAETVSQASKPERRGDGFDFGALAREFNARDLQAVAGASQKKAESKIIKSPNREEPGKQDKLNAAFIEAVKSGNCDEARAFLRQGGEEDAWGQIPGFLGLPEWASAEQIATKNSDRSMLAVIHEQQDTNRDFLTAVKKGDLEGATAALENGAHPDARDDNWKTGLMLAMWTGKDGNLAMAELLAPISDTNAKVYSARPRNLSNATSFCVSAELPTIYFALANDTLQTGAEVGAKSDATATQMMKLLIANGANVNAPLSRGTRDTVTHTAGTGGSHFNGTYSYLRSVGGVHEAPKDY